MDSLSFVRECFPFLTDAEITSAIVDSKGDLELAVSLILSRFFAKNTFTDESITLTSSDDEYSETEFFESTSAYSKG